MWYSIRHLTFHPMHCSLLCSLLYDVPVPRFHGGDRVKVEVHITANIEETGTPIYHQLKMLPLRDARVYRAMVVHGNTQRSRGGETYEQDAPITPPSAVRMCTAVTIIPIAATATFLLLPLLECALF